MEVTTRATQNYLGGTIRIGGHKRKEQGYSIDETIYRTRTGDIFYLERVIVVSHGGVLFYEKDLL